MWMEIEIGIRSSGSPDAGASESVAIASIPFARRRAEPTPIETVLLGAPSILLVTREGIRLIYTRFSDGIIVSEVRCATACAGRLKLTV